MNSNRPEDSEVAELPEVLSGELLILQAAYRAAEQRDAEPSSAVDDALRAAARRAVHAGPEVPLTRSFFHFPTFATPLAAAAVIVLAVSVGFLSMNEPFMQRHLQPEPPMAVSVLPAGPVVPAAPASPGQAEVQAGEAKSKVAEDRGAAAAVATSRSPASVPVERPAAPPEPAKIGANVASAAKPVPPQAGAAAAAPAPSPATSAPPITADAAKLKDSPAREERARAAVAAASAEGRVAPSEPPPVVAQASGVTAPVPAYATAPAPAPIAAKVAVAPPAPPSSVPPVASPAPVSPPSANRDILLAESSDARLKGLAKRERYEAPAAPAAASVPAPAPSPSPALSSIPGRIDESQPKAWLEAIVRLKTAGRAEQAAEQLKRFRERYPDHPLPDSLKENPAK